MKQNIIKDKSFAFAIRVLKLHKFLNENEKEYVVSKQLCRSCTSIGALVREAEHAESKSDFIHKMSIGLKEANESVYWIELLYYAGYLNEKEFNSLNNDVTEILKLLVSIIKSSKNIK